MRPRNYGQYCGLAYALDLVGERWALLVIRDLLLGPRRFTDIARGLPGIPSNILSARLKQLEADGIASRRLLPRPDGSIVYELTDYGRELEGILLALGLWGARSLGAPRETDVLTPTALVLALRASFQPDAARADEATYQVSVGEITVHARVREGMVEVTEGAAADADLALAGDPSLLEVMTGRITPEQAVEQGTLAVTGDRGLLPRFAELFRLPPPLPAVEAVELTPERT
jgi:DNA-binding HxlR family transcriptional regulator